MNDIVNYSHFENENVGLGLRHDLIFYLVKLIDQAGWIDENGTHRSNSDENVTEISDWIFGEGKHVNEGVLDSLSSRNRGIVGLYDLLSFRLFCSADRGGDIFNLTRSLAKHGDPKAPTEGSTKIIAIEEMREISQKVFQIVKKQYITPKINIFDLIDSLSIDDVIGRYKSFLIKRISSGEVENAEDTLAHLKSRMKLFISYQLGSSSTDHGITCGFYDPKGKEDKNQIRTQINKYLFEVCFNPGTKKELHKNYEHFLDYLLINLTRTIEPVKGKSFVPNINEFTKVLKKEDLLKYWKMNRRLIKALKFDEMDKPVMAGNYIANYKEDLCDVYELLDASLKELRVIKKRTKQ